MRTELRLAPHSNPLGNRTNAVVCEVWHNGQFIAQIVGAPDGAGINVLSKYALATSPGQNLERINVVKVEVKVVQ